ncbi:ABC transporter permease [Viridibacillus sp. FSL H8-0110]|uniref:ABC transporter permease n=1 Tax=Viridibacillus sp. FSL H8-0110 TaxID=2921376 RepID=UPI0030F68B82
MDALIYTVLLLILLILNASAIYMYKNDKLDLWLSGIIIGILGPVFAFLIGAIFVKYEHSQGATAEGAQIAAAFIGLIIVANGIIYFIVGITLKLIGFLKYKRA